MKLSLRQILTDAVAHNASDLHCLVGNPVTIRQHGALTDLYPEPLTDADTRALLDEIATEEQKRLLWKRGDVDISYELPGQERFRINIFRQRRSVAIAARVIPGRVPTLLELEMPPILLQLSRLQRGLVLVTGPTGSGKSTTVASLVHQINMERRCTIITLEDPVEYLYQKRKSLISQREIGVDVDSFASGLRAALREDPDVIVVGEMRDLDTMTTAIQAAETGHLVFATLHTTDAVQTIDRIIDVFPSHQQQQIRMQLSMILQGIVSQQLLPRRGGKGRVAACEILLLNPAVRNMIRTGKTHQLNSTMQTSGRSGMQTMDMALEALSMFDVIDMDAAMALATDPDSIFASQRKKWTGQ